MKSLIITLLWIGLIGWLLLAFTSCTMTIAADGAKSFSVDGVQADHDMRRPLRGRPITDLEIAFRWKPLP